MEPRKFLLAFVLIVYWLNCTSSKNNVSTLSRNNSKMHINKRRKELSTNASLKNIVFPLRRWEAEIEKRLKNPKTTSIRYSSLLNTDDVQCKLKLCKKCVSLFRHNVKFSEATFVYLKLVPSSGVTITAKENIVGEDIWVWTFYGKEGGFQFLNWPIEFGIWSMGLLTSYTLTDPQVMILQNVTGNCSNIQIGRTKDDKIISNALLNLTLEMMNFSKEKYGPSHFCYKRRKYIQPRVWYIICKHIVCPLEALEYNCCSYYYQTKLEKRKVTCRFPNHVVEYEDVGWILPTVVSVVLFAYFPLFILYVAYLLMEENADCPINGSRNVLLDDYESGTSSDRIITLNEHHHITLFKTLCSPLSRCKKSVLSKASGFRRIVLKRSGRFLLPFLSLFVIGLQVCLDFLFLHSFVLAAVSKGVPMGFRSLIAGYEQSKDNFLPYLGGPYTAVGMYLVITCILIAIPDNLSSLLISGLPGNDINESVSPLCIRMRSIEIFGSVSIRKRHGFRKLHSFFLSQFYMFINGKYWGHVFSVQLERWKCLYCSKCCAVFLPLYIIFCFFELLLCLILYGIPIVSFGLTIIKAYCGSLPCSQRRQRCFVKPFYGFITVIFIACVLFFLYMFCTIFMDATLFFTRVVFFTFTGVVVYPKVSYGYLIFTLTVIYYIWQCVQDFSNVYQNLLKDIINICSQLQRANDRNRLLIKKGGLKGIRESLFEYVIETHFPKRKQVFISLLKVGIVLTVLGLLINILIETDGFRELHVVMHVGTALFICAFPQIMKNMCHGYGQVFRQRRLQRQLRKTIVTYVGYTESTDVSSCSE